MGFINQLISGGAPPCISAIDDISGLDPGHPGGLCGAEHSPTGRLLASPLAIKDLRFPNPKFCCFGGG